MNTLLILPVVVPLITAALMFLAFRRALTQRVIGVVSCFVQLAIAVVLLYTINGNGIQVSQMGAWPAPFGITFVGDMLAALMVMLSSIIGLSVVIYSISKIDRVRRAYGFYPLMQILLMGANGAFLTGDLFNLYVWFEVLLIASFVLLVLGNERPQMEGALKYVMLNLLSSMLFLTAVGILYGSVNALNMADIATRVGDLPASIHTAIAMLFLVAFGIKAAVFPLFFWLPDSYHTPPATIGALFAALLTKVGVYSLLRIFTLIFPDTLSSSQVLFLGIAAFGMICGGFGAMAQSDVRRLLALSSISQVGYIIMGLALFSTMSLAGGVYFILHHSIVKSNLFLVAGLIKSRGGSTNLKIIGNLLSREPLLASLFFVSALSLAGVPPLSGFWAKLGLVQAGLMIGTPAVFTIVGISLAAGIFTLIAMMKVWNEAFWKSEPEGMAPLVRETTKLAVAAPFLPIIVMTALTIVMGLVPGPLLALVNTAAEQLMEPSQYISAVLGKEVE